jgi:hypothetical protein
VERHSQQHQWRMGPICRLQSRRDFHDGWLQEERIFRTLCAQADYEVIREEKRASYSDGVNERLNKMND